MAMMGVWAMRVRMWQLIMFVHVDVWFTWRIMWPMFIMMVLIMCVVSMVRAIEFE
jgi:hypothetical protein